MNQKTLARQSAFTAAYGDQLPKSICTCGHTGDGARGQHRDGGWGVKGHGSCSVKGCACTRFSWAQYTDMFKAKLAEVK